MKYIEIIDGSSHRHTIPLWQLPALVAEEIAREKGHRQDAADKASFQAAQEKAFAEHQAQEQVKIAESLAAPLDLTDAQAGW